MQMAIKIAKLSNKSSAELQILWSDYFDTPPYGTSKEFLISRIAHRMQELEYGGLSTSIAQMLLRTERKVETGNKVPPPGSRITKKFKGKEYCVKVMIDGFEFNGMQHNSLSAVAQLITGKKISGFRFFGLEKGEKNDQ